MTTAHIVELAVAVVLAVLGAVMAMAEAALASFSRARADRLVDEGRPGAARVSRIVADPPRYLNTALFLRLVCEVVATVFVARVIFALCATPWLAIGLTCVIMIVVSYIGWGVAPRTLGRQHADRVAGALSGPVVALTTVLGPFPRLLILIGNALTPGKGFSEGPFASEAELRELVDLAEQSDLIESGERQMIHSVFELGDTVVREVMVPRTEMLYIERTKTLRQAMWLSLGSGFSRIPVVGEGGLDDIVGVLYLKDVIKRVFEHPGADTGELVESQMRPPQWCPDSKPVDQLLRDMQLKRSHLVIVVDEFGGTAGMATIEDIVEEIVGEIRDEYDEREQVLVTDLGDGRYEVSSRLPIDDLGELFGLELDDEDVDTVGGLMAKELNRVPIEGSEIEVFGLRLVAQRGTGRRNRIGTIVVDRVAHEDEDVGESASEQTVRFQAIRDGDKTEHPMEQH